MVEQHNGVMMNPRNSFPAFVHLALGLCIAATLGSTGCVPDHMAPFRHIKAPAVEPAATEKEQLIEELQRPLDPDDYVPAEQIAVYAAYELQRGNPWDAGVLLSLASYRYRQQAFLAVAMGQAQSWRINADVSELFQEWIANEFKVFARLNFDDELDLLRKHLFGISVAQERSDEYLEKLARGGKEDDSFVQRLTEVQTEISNRPERLAHPELAAAFLARLRRDHRSSGEKFTPSSYYLAATPLDSFRLAALDEVKIPFNPILARNMVPRMQTLGKQVRARLESKLPNTRANAAAILGLASDPADVALLEAKLQHETNDMVIDSIRFALIRHGKEEHLAHLVDRAPSALFSEERDHALVLLQWLPEETKAKLDETLFVELARERMDVISTFGRAFALVILRDIASQRALGQDSVMAVIELTANPEEEVAKAAARVVEALEQLSAEECKTLYPKYPNAQAALISRLANVASLGDLEFLDRVHATSDDEDVRMAAASAVANVPGAASLQLLKRWLVEASGDEEGMAYMMLVTLLAARADVAQAELHALSLSRPQRVMIEIALDRPQLASSAASRDDGSRKSARPDFAGLPASIDQIGIKDVMQIAIQANFFRRPALIPTLWKLARYRNDQRYPVDAVVRRYGMSALVRVALRYYAQRSTRATAGR